MTPVILAKALADSNGDGIIALGAANQKLYGVKTLYGPEKHGGQFYYWPAKVHPTVAEWLAEKTEPAAAVPIWPASPLPPAGTRKVGAVSQITRASATLVASRLLDLSGGSIGRRIQSGAIIDRLVMEDLRTTALGRLLYILSGGLVKRLEVARVAAEGILPGEPFIGLRGSSTHEVTALIQDVEGWYSPKPNTTKSNIPTLIHLGVSAETGRIKEAVLERIRGGGAISNYGSSQYWNGDLITAERSVDLLDLRHICGKDCVDSIIDTKARRTIGQHIHAEGALGNIKLWGETHLKQVRSVNPIKRGGSGGAGHIRLMGGTHVIEGLEAVGAAPLIILDNGVNEFHGTGSFDGKTLIARGAGKLKAGSTWNGSVIA